LIAFDTDLNIEHRQRGEKEKYRPVRPRTLIYVFGLVVTAALMGWGLTNRAVTGINVLHDRNPLFVQEGDGSVMNAFTVRMLNMQHKPRRFALTVSGVEGLEITKVAEGMFAFKKAPDGKFVVDVEPDTTRELRVLVVLPKQANMPKSKPITFTARDVETGERLSRSDFFKGPGSN
jgi:polyferredoxin